MRFLINNVVIVAGKHIRVEEISTQKIDIPKIIRLNCGYTSAEVIY